MAVIEQEMMTHQGLESPVLDISESAAVRLQEMMSERSLSGYSLRVFVSGGGCSGLQYGMTFDDEVRADDTAWESHGLRLLVDPISARYLHGTSITYQTNNMLAGAFQIDNPNAVSSCGCGHSFKAKNDDAAEAYDGYDEGTSGGGCGHCNHG